MKEYFDGMAKLADVFFNGRSAEPPDTKVTIQELIRRKNSMVRVDGKLYEVKVKEVELIG